MFFYAPINADSASKVGGKKFDQVKLDLKQYDETIEDKKSLFLLVPKDLNDKEWVKKKLFHMVEIDQYTRKFLNTPNRNKYSEEEKEYFHKKFMPRFSSLDKENTTELKKLLNRYGWFKISEFGEQADRGAWLLVQHADLDLDFQKEVLTTLAKLYPIGETNRTNYAYLYDRVKAIGEGRPQRYGTQGQCVGKGIWKPHKIEEPENVDERRKSMGMPSMEEYKSGFKNICN